MFLFLGIGPPFVNPGVCVSGQHLDSHWRGHRHSGQRLSCSVEHFPSQGRARWGWGTALVFVTTSPIFQKCVFFSPFICWRGENFTLFLRV